MAEAKPQPKSKAVYFTLVGFSVAILLLTPIFILMGVGFFFDMIFKISPILTVAGAIVGFLSGMVNIYKLLTRMNAK